MRDMGVRTLLLSLLTVVAVATTGNTATAATPAAPPRAVVESASASWVIVHDTRSTSPISVGARGGAFEAISLVGDACTLSPNQSPPWTPGTPISVVGDSYVQAEPANGYFSMRVHVQQECDRFSDSAPGLSYGETLLTSAPNGYLTEARDGDHAGHLIRYQTPNEVTTFATPFPISTPWIAVAGDAGVVAYTVPTKTTSTPSLIRFMPWTKPGSWRTLFTSAPRTTLACTPPSSTYVACTVQARGPGLLALDGNSRTWLYAAHPTACRQVSLATAGNTLVALETSNAGVCTAGQLYQLAADGRLTNGSSRRLYSVPAGIHGGLGGILVSTADQHYVMRLKNVTDPGSIAWPAQGY